MAFDDEWLEMDDTQYWRGYLDGLAIAFAHWPEYAPVDQYKTYIQEIIHKTEQRVYGRSDDGNV